VLSLYADVIRYPDLFMNIFRRELHGKYRGSILGLFWTLLNPLALMGVYTFVFSVLLKAFDIEHYPLFILSGLVTWVFFQSAVQMACSSLFGQPSLVKQVRFPRHFLPLAVVATNIVTLGAMLVVVVAVNLVFIPEMRTTFWVAFR
jgi:ABC-type polysaccharide/polyol phosphate export permease